MPETSLPRIPVIPSSGRTRTAIAALSALVAASLAVMSTLHLTGVISGVAPDNPAAAGVAEAVIAAVLLAGTVVVARAPVAVARPVGMGAVGFAVIGFLVGLTITLGGGTVVDIAYHVSTLPVLLLVGGLLVGWQVPAAERP